MLSEFNYYDSKENKDMIGYYISGMAVGDAKVREVQKKDGSGSFKAASVGIGNFSEVCNLDGTFKIASVIGRIKKYEYVFAVCKDINKRTHEGKEYTSYIVDSVFITHASGQSATRETREDGMKPVSDEGLPF